jgi:hypothetical protein
MIKNMNEYNYVEGRTYLYSVGEMQEGGHLLPRQKTCRHVGEVKYLLLDGRSMCNECVIFIYNNKLRLASFLPKGGEEPTTEDIYKMRINYNKIAREGNIILKCKVDNPYFVTYYVLQDFQKI